MEFNVSVQGNFYATIEAPNTGAALAVVSNQIASGGLIEIDPNRPQNIVITPKNND